MTFPMISIFLYKRGTKDTSGIVKLIDIIYSSVYITIQYCTRQTGNQVYNNILEYVLLTGIVCTLIP